MKEPEYLVLEDKQVFTDPKRDLNVNLSMEGNEDKSDRNSQNKIGGFGTPLLRSSPRNMVCFIHLHIFKMKSHLLVINI